MQAGFYGSIIKRCYGHTVKLSTYVFLQVVIHPSEISMVLEATPQSLRIFRKFNTRSKSKRGHFVK